MNIVEKVLDGVQNLMNVNSATFSGAVDIIVVPQEDGSLACTSWHVRFGKLQLLNTSEKKVRPIDPHWIPQSWNCAFGTFETLFLAFNLKII
jgi:hypothetical protein